MITLERVCKSFGAAAPAVAGLDLEVKKGELLALLGGSGSGKTTTLKMINRLLEPTSGRILVDGADISTRDPVQLQPGANCQGGEVDQRSGLAGQGMQLLTRGQFRLGFLHLRSSIFIQLGAADSSSRQETQEGGRIMLLTEQPLSQVAALSKEGDIMINKKH